MYSSVCKSNKLVIALESVKGIITKGLTYELLYEVDNGDSIHYEIIADDGMYIQLKNNYFYKIEI